MPEKEKPQKKQRKDSQLIIRINSSDRDRFVSLCDDLDTSAAREVRRFIRDFLATNDTPADPLHHPKKEQSHGEES